MKAQSENKNNKNNSQSLTSPDNQQINMLQEKYQMISNFIAQSKTHPLSKIEEICKTKIQPGQFIFIVNEDPIFNKIVNNNPKQIETQCKSPDLIKVVQNVNGMDIQNS